MLPKKELLYAGMLWDEGSRKMWRGDILKITSIVSTGLIWMLHIEQVSYFNRG
jgi:hypothetical protein